MSTTSDLTSLLKSGRRSPRKQVSLNLAGPEAVGTPRASAGNYSVVVQRPAENNLGRLVGALGQFAAAGLRTVAEERRAADAQTAEVLQSLTPDELQALRSGEMDGKLEETMGKLDAAQRKRLIKFSENPNNYVRSSQLVGSMLATHALEDLKSNAKDYYTKDATIPDQLKEYQGKIEADFGLTGNQLVGFRQMFNANIGKIQSALEAEQNVFMEQNHRLNTESALTAMAKNGNWTGLAEVWATHTNQNTPAEQGQILAATFDTMLKQYDWQAAREFITFLSDENSGISLGTAGVPSSLVEDMSVQLEQAQRNRENMALDDERRAKYQFEAMMDVGIAASVRGGGAPEAVFWIASSGQKITIPATNEARTPEEYIDFVQGIVSREAGDNMTATEKVAFMTSWADKRANYAMQRKQWEAQVGAESVIAGLDTNMQAVDNLTRSNAYNLRPEEMKDLMDGWQEELQSKLSEVYYNPDLKEDQKYAQGKLIVRDFQREKRDFLNGKRSDPTKVNELEDVYRAFGVGATDEAATKVRRQYEAIALQDSRNPLTGEVEGITSNYRNWIANNALRYQTELQEGLKEIWQRPRQANEADLTDIEFRNQKYKEAAEFKRVYLIDFEQEMREGFGKIQEPLSYDDQKVIDDAGDFRQALLKRSKELVSERYDAVVDDYGSRDIARRMVSRKDYLFRQGQQNVLRGLFNFTHVAKARSQWTDMEITQRVLERDENGLTPTEVKNARIEGGFQLDPEMIGPTNVPLLSRSQILGTKEDAVDTIKEYLKALGDDAERPANIDEFWRVQTELFAKGYGISREIKTIDLTTPTE